MNNSKNRYTLKQFIEYAQKVHGDKYVYDRVEYTNNRTKVIIICKEHGEFTQRPKDHLYGRGCKNCSIERRKSVKTQTFIKNATEKHGNTYRYFNVEFINYKAFVKIICPIHGEFEQRPDSHLLGKGCRKCKYEDLAQKFRCSNDEFIKKAEDVHNNHYDYSKVKYVNNKTPVTIICPVHGEFEQRPNDHLSGKGCGNCYRGISKKANNWLDQFKNIKRELPIKVGDKTYIVDGINKKTRTIYEFWGDFWHGNPKLYKADELNPITKTTFGVLYKKTQNKIKDLKSAGYIVISIWECEWDKQK